MTPIYLCRAASVPVSPELTAWRRIPAGSILRRRLCALKRALASFLAVVLPLATAAQQEWFGPETHDIDFSASCIDSIAFSPDGTRLAAAYCWGPMNRARSDWDRWVAVWDVETGRSLLLTNAIAPLAFSSDGTVLAMTLFERGRMRPNSGKLALWNLDDNSPMALLEPPANTEGNDPGPAPMPMAARFHLNQRLIAFYRSGDLVLFSPDGTATRLAGADELFGADGPTPESLALSHASLRVGRNGSTWELLISNEAHSAAPVAVQWSLGAQPPIRAIQRFDPRTRSWPRHEFTEWSGRFPGPDSPHMTRPYSPDRPGRWRPSLPMATLGNFHAVSLPGRSHWRRHHHEPWQLLPSGASSIAFSPTATRVATAERGGAIRIWNLDSGAIERTLVIDAGPREKYRFVWNLRPEDAAGNVFRAAAIQIESHFGDPEKNREQLRRQIVTAANGGAKIIVLPEAAVTGYLSPDLKQAWQIEGRPVAAGVEGVDPRAVAETVPGPSTRFFSRLAQAHGIYLTVPLVEIDPLTGRFYNTVVLLGPDGGRLLHYRKLNPWPWAEQGWADEGNLGTPVVDTPFGRLGLLVCFDIHQQAQRLAELKVDTLLYSIAWVDSEGSDWFQSSLPSIAKRHGMNIVGANWTVDKPHSEQWHGHGQSRIINAKGDILAAADTTGRPAIIITDLPLPKPPDQSPHSSSR